MPSRPRAKETALARAVAAQGKYPVKAVANTLGVARSNPAKELPFGGFG